MFRVVVSVVVDCVCMCVWWVCVYDGLCFPLAWLCGLVACSLLPPSGHVLQCLAEVQTALKLGPGLGPPPVGSRAGGPHVGWGHSTWEYVRPPWRVVAPGASGVCLCALTCPMPGYMGVWLFTRTRCLSELSVCIPGYEPDTTRHWTGTPRAAAGVAIGRDRPPWESAAGAPTDSNLGFPVQGFDRLLGVLQAALAKDPGTGFVFSCLSGQGRTTTAMVVAVLAFWHIRVCEDRGLLRQQGPVGPWGPRRGQEGLGAELVPGVVPEAPPVSPGQTTCGLADPQRGFWARGCGRVQSGSWLPVPAAVLSQGFPEVGEEELVSVPDAKFTKGEFEVSVPPRVPGGHLQERG